MSPLRSMEKLFFAIFGQAKHYDLITINPREPPPFRPDWTKILFKVAFAVYMLLTVVVLLKLLIATMSDTYKHFQAQSDIEWKFGLSKLIRNIDLTTTAPSPINLITTWLCYLIELYRTKVYKNPIDVFEKLFFAVFGQTAVEHLQTKKYEQTVWTNTLFKIVFGIYMLVSVVVLINLLIAMMTDTYQRIQAQSDIEWKFGLCKLIRNMHRTSTAPSPINLFTTWLFYFIELCKSARVKNKKGPSVTQVVNTFRGMSKDKPMSPTSKAAYKWLSLVRKDMQIIPKERGQSISVPLKSPSRSHMTVVLEATRIEHVTDWELIAKKYRKLMGYMEDQKESENTEDI